MHITIISAGLEICRVIKKLHLGKIAVNCISQKASASMKLRIMKFYRSNFSYQRKTLHKLTIFIILACH